MTLLLIKDNSEIRLSNRITVHDELQYMTVKGFRRNQKGRNISVLISHLSTGNYNLLIIVLLQYVTFKVDFSLSKIKCFKDVLHPSYVIMLCKH